MEKIIPSSDKKELLAQLYVFRGMLGEVYCAADNYEQSKLIFEEQKSVVENLSNKFNELPETIVNTIAKHKQCHNDAKLRITMIVGLSLACGLIFLTTIKYLIPLLDGGPQLLLIYPILFAVPAALFFGIKWIKNYRRGSPSLRVEKKAKKEYEYYIQNNRDDNNVKLLKKYPDEIATAKKAANEKYKPMIINQRKYCEKKEVLKNMFAEFLIERDWGMIDTLLYMVSSGRADTMKEALNTGDLAIRHEQMIGEIKRTQLLLANLTNTTIQCTRALCMGMNQLNDSINRVGNKIDSLSECVRQAGNSINKTIEVSSIEMTERIGRINYQLEK
ncbi:MAG TPA: hypothetical protein DEQ88_04750 [Clostridiales bacterium]|nr:hypothetical protein [Clostridiales bacterium]